MIWLFIFPGYFSCGHQVDYESLHYISSKLNFGPSLNFIDREVTDILRNMIVKNEMYPVTLTNLLEVYKFLYSGCKTNNINLSIWNTGSSLFNWTVVTTNLNRIQSSHIWIRSVRLICIKWCQFGELAVHVAHMWASKVGNCITQVTSTKQPEIWIWYT